MIRIIWAIATITSQGLLLGDVADSKRFDQQDACEAFGKEMTPRMEDWVRGMIKAPWDHKVAIKYRCEIEGTPS